MKPLPFNMTPLAQSLNLAPAPRLGADPSAAKPSVAAKSAAPVVKSSAVDNPTNEATNESAALVRQPEKPSPQARVGPKSRRPKNRTNAQSTQARRESKRDVPAERPQSTPTTELRTAIYPRHVCAGDGWAGRLASEQIHALATHVLARHMQQNLRTLAVTSALAGEGKTTVTLALAEKLAGADKRVLILDLDTHRATLSHEAGLEDAAGALQSSDPADIANLEFHAYATDVPGVAIMPAGYQPSGITGPPLLSPVHIGVLVLDAIEKYDIVILDCPPLLPVAETFVLREVVDAALMVVRAGVTPKDMLDQAIDDFGREKFMGAILNRTKPGDIPYFREVYGYYRRNSSRG